MSTRVPAISTYPDGADDKDCKYGGQLINVTVAPPPATQPPTAVINGPALATVGQPVL
jgi:hypothetical protein